MARSTAVTEQPKPALPVPNAESRASRPAGTRCSGWSKDQPVQYQACSAGSEAPKHCLYRCSRTIRRASYGHHNLHLRPERTLHFSFRTSDRNPPISFNCAIRAHGLVERAGTASSGPHIQAVGGVDCVPVCETDRLEWALSECGRTSYEGLPDLAANPAH